MKKQLLFLLVLTITFASCNLCANLDCISSNYFSQLRIISKADDKDLVFGSTSVYDKTKIKFYTLSGNDTTFFDCTSIKYPGSGYDSILYVNFYPEATTPVFMKLSDSDTDTLAITYYSYNTKCCGRITEIEKLRYNNSIDIVMSRGIHEIRK